MSESNHPALPGIHHVTAICGDPQRNVDFYSGLLGLRLVKKTVNFDDPGTYHLYYGDGAGSPGTLMTFFAWIGLPPMASANGRQGTGQISATAFSVLDTALDFWVDRLSDEAIDFEGPFERLGSQVLSFSDFDGLPLEIVASEGGELRAPWRDGPVPTEHAIEGIGGITMCLTGYESTAHMLTNTLGFREVGHENNRYRFEVGKGSDVAFVDLLVEPDAGPGRMGLGAVHHVAWRTPSHEAHEQWRRAIAAEGFNITPILDRQYFESLYFLEPGGVLFELATDPPGFTRDEPVESLGTELKLPPWLEPRRAAIEARLPELRPVTGTPYPRDEQPGASM